MPGASTKRSTLAARSCHQSAAKDYLRLWVFEDAIWYNLLSFWHVGCRNAHIIIYRTVFLSLVYIYNVYIMFLVWSQLPVHMSFSACWGLPQEEHCHKALFDITSKSSISLARACGFLDALTDFIDFIDEVFFEVKSITRLDMDFCNEHGFAEKRVSRCLNH